MKFLLDQTVGSVGNIVLFIVLINLLKGVGVGGVWGLVVEVFISFIHIILFCSVLIYLCYGGYVWDMLTVCLDRTSNLS